MTTIMTKRARSRIKEAAWIYEDLTELKELYADVKLTTKKLEAILGKIAQMTTYKESEYFEYIGDFDEEQCNDRLTKDS